MKLPRIGHYEDSHRQRQYAAWPLGVLVEVVAYLLVVLVTALAALAAGSLL